MIKHFSSDMNIQIEMVLCVCTSYSVYYLFLCDVEAVMDCFALLFSFL